jgi:hypothetical protein
MRKVLAALIAIGCFAAAAALSAGTANAQVDTWNGGWHVGGDYYQPEYGYGAAPNYGYGSAPLYNYASAPIYNYSPAPAYGAAPIYDYASPPNYGYGSAAAYGTVAVAAPVQTVEIVRTVYLPARSAAHRAIVTRQPVRHVAAVTTHSAPLYNYSGTASVVAPAPTYHNATYYDYAAGTRPLYDTAAVPLAQPVAAPANAGPVYRYVYQRDRILVMDPSTDTVIHTIPR